MAGAIGKINASLASVYNENSAALANLNFDFTLVKVEAPAEYSALGTAISRKRKIDAEDGGLHRTARQLGALFEAILPPADDLYRAYGKRVSEISSIPKINPTNGLNSGGIFAGHVGADMTSIWAAATSGSAAIAVHMLGCMLARIFSGPEAISVWVEIVERRKENIRGEQVSALYAGENRPAMVAAKQHISREDLANWDASARAWLQSADEAKALQHKQTKLIFDNANLPVNNEPMTYASVTGAWTTALEAVNNLVKGIPQRVQDGAALLALSSWHLYPDICVYGEACVEVKQNDPLFNRAALLTVGLQHVRDDVTSVYWSLPLACLQYYGHPVQASRSLSADNSRIDHRQFAYIVIGCIFSTWRNYAATNEDGLQCLKRLADLLSLSATHRVDLTHKPTWLIYAIVAAKEHDDLETSEKVIAKQLMNLGRRYPTFIQGQEKYPPPIFGLSLIGPLVSVLSDDQKRVDCLRRLCAHLMLDGSNFLIKYAAPIEEEEEWTEYSTMVEYSTVVQVEQISAKRLSTSKLKSAEFTEKKYIRYISLSHDQLQLLVRRQDDFKDIEQARKKLRELEESERREVAPGSSSRPLDRNLESPDRTREFLELNEVVAIGLRRAAIEKSGELYLPLVEHLPNLDSSAFGAFRSQAAMTSLMFPNSLDFIEAVTYHLNKKNDHQYLLDAIRIANAPCAGGVSTAALYSVQRRREAMHQDISDMILAPWFFWEFFTPDNVSPGLINGYFSKKKQHQSVETQISSLRACAMVDEIYHLLPGATISTLSVKIPLPQARWSQDRNSDLSSSLSRTFACIAMFESGTCNLDPFALKEVFALASGNSLYVAGMLLCDPYEQPSDTEIRRVVGNVGRPGITLLVSPSEVKMREASPENWMMINHNAFDGRPENHFDKTSVHLSFTNYVIPFETETTSRHVIDRTVNLVETLVSIHDGGTWIGEVDILKGLKSQVRRASGGLIQCTHSAVFSKENTYPEILLRAPWLAATSIENWDELIEAPSIGTLAIRAHKNWIARLAATAVCVKLGLVPVILPGDVCWRCCAEEVPDQESGRIAMIY